MLICLDVSRCIVMMRCGCCGTATNQHLMHKPGTNPQTGQQHTQQNLLLPNRSPLLAPKMWLAVCSVSSRVFLPELSSLMACRKTLKLSLDSRCLRQTLQWWQAAKQTQNNMCCTTAAVYNRQAMQLHFTKVLLFYTNLAWLQAPFAAVLYGHQHACRLVQTMACYSQLQPTVTQATQDVNRAHSSNSLNSSSQHNSLKQMQEHSSCTWPA